MVLENFFNAIFGPLIEISALVAIVSVSFILTLITTIAYKYLTDQEALKNLRAENKKLQEEIKQNKDNPEKMMQLQKQMLSKGLVEPFKHQLKPMLITFIPLILVFTWLRTTFADAGKIFLIFGWLGTYIVFSIIFSIILRKLLKVH